MLSPERLLEFGPLGLFLVAFFESTVFPIPPDVLLLPLCLMAPRLSWWYAFLTTSASVSGALLGYIVGRKAGRPVVERLVSQEMMDKVHLLFERYGGWAVGVAAFTPLPYKVFTFGAGIFRVPLWSFAVASLIGRSARFFLEGALVYSLGERARDYLGRNFEIATLALTGALLLAVALYPKIEAYFRGRKHPRRPSFVNLPRSAYGAGLRLRSLGAVGARILSGVSASAVLLLLSVTYLEDLAGPERMALDRSLMPFYERFAGVTDLHWIWDTVGSPWFHAALVSIGIARFLLWARARATSGVYRNTVRLALLSAAVYAIDRGVSGYLSAAYGNLSGGRALLAPFFLVFGAYLLTKGAKRYAQLLTLTLASVISAGHAAYLVLSTGVDAAAATASLLVSAFTLTLSYTALAAQKPI